MGCVHNPPHPGTVLQAWLAEVSVTQAAAQLGVTRAYFSRILHGHASISADMDHCCGEPLLANSRCGPDTYLLDPYDLLGAQ